MVRNYIPKKCTCALFGGGGGYAAQNMPIHPSGNGHSLGRFGWTEQSGFMGRVGAGKMRVADGWWGRRTPSELGWRWMVLEGSASVYDCTPGGGETPSLDLCLSGKNWLSKSNVTFLGGLHRLSCLQRLPIHTKLLLCTSHLFLKMPLFAQMNDFV